jgi:hypothetical protein
MTLPGELGKDGTVRKFGSKEEAIFCDPMGKCERYLVCSG